ncbi:MAG: hypothetical protein JWN06_2391 [Propionibacteriaceae bacterium]|jgi:hypothetical protein|nr:hypothetical protein [Propionibacteriaceae bacterium]
MCSVSFDEGGEATVLTNIGEVHYSEATSKPRWATSSRRCPIRREVGDRAR